MSNRTLPGSPRSTLARPNSFVVSGFLLKGTRRSGCRTSIQSSQERGTSMTTNIRGTVTGDAATFLGVHFQAEGKMLAFWIRRNCGCALKRDFDARLRVHYVLGRLMFHRTIDSSIRERAPRVHPAAATMLRRYPICNSSMADVCGISPRSICTVVDMGPPSDESLVRGACQWMGPRYSSAQEDQATPYRGLETEGYRELQQVEADSRRLFYGVGLVSFIVFDCFLHSV